jgi:hypothetical protein
VSRLLLVVFWCVTALNVCCLVTRLVNRLNLAHWKLQRNASFLGYPLLQVLAYQLLQSLGLFKQQCRAFQQPHPVSDD